jgi:hypothetical protein
MALELQGVSSAWRRFVKFPARGDEKLRVEPGAPAVAFPPMPSARREAGQARGKLVIAL